LFWDFCRTVGRRPTLTRVVDGIYVCTGLFKRKRRRTVATAAEERNRVIVLEAFDTLFNQRDYAAAHEFWSPNYIQHSAHIEPGREGLFELVKAAPPDMRYENGLVVASGDYVMLHGRFSNVGQPADWIVADIVRIQDGLLAEHWDVIQDEATTGESKSGLPMFGDTFPART
jgi:predicted SnoaL-like aldol condensation-catalyzing enzyme